MLEALLNALVPPALPGLRRRRRRCVRGVPSAAAVSDRPALRSVRSAAAVRPALSCRAVTRSRRRTRRSHTNGPAKDLVHALKFHHGRRAAARWPPRSPRTRRQIAQQRPCPGARARAPQPRQRPRLRPGRRAGRRPRPPHRLPVQRILRRRGPATRQLGASRARRTEAGRIKIVARSAAPPGRARLESASGSDDVRAGTAQRPSAAQASAAPGGRTRRRYTGTIHLCCPRGAADLADDLDPARFRASRAAGRRAGA